MAFASDTTDGPHASSPTGKVPANGKPSISTNPVFPWLVATWFAALFGFGSLVLPTALIESIVTAIGLPGIAPATAPPLGFRAHMLIALAAAIGGSVLGFIIARKVAQKHNAPAPRMASDLDPHARESRGPLDRPAKKPISAQAELGSEAFDEPVHPGFGQMAGRRRALSVTDENARSDFLFEATLAGGRETAGGTFEDAFSEPRPLDLDDFELDDDADYEAEDIADTSLAGLLAQGRDDAARDAEPFVHDAPTDADTPDHVVFAEEADAAPQPFVSGDDTQPGTPPETQPAAVFGQQQETPTMPEATAFDHDAAPPQPFAVPAPPVMQTADAPADQPGIAARALRDLGTAELVERFALALQSHKDRAAEDARIAAEAPLALPSFGMNAGGADVGEQENDFVPPPPFDFGAPVPEEVTLPEGFGAEPAAELAPQVPAFMRPVDAPEVATDSFDDLPDLGMPALAETDDDSDGEEADDDFSSLLSMRSAFSGDETFVRVEDNEETGETEPVVVFPGEAQFPPQKAPDAVQTEAPKPAINDAAVAPARQNTPFGAPQPSASPGETEKALREALEKLQRMSGAA